MRRLREELFQKYQDELSCIRQLAMEFADEYPREASRLRLEPDRCEDPHVERLLEGFALIAARIHLKLDDDFPEISTAVLEALYPHYLRPVPSMSVIEFGFTPEQKVSEPTLLPRGTVLHSSRIRETQCTFRTVYDATVWPLQITNAVWHSHTDLPPAIEHEVAVLKLSLECRPDVTFDKLGVPSLRFFLFGAPRIANALYELLLNNCSSITLWDGKNTGSRIQLPPSSLQPVGFAENEAILPYTARSFSGYRLLQEYFAFPEKFLFVELSGLDRVLRRFESSVAIEFGIKSFRQPGRHTLLAREVSADNFRLGCSPVVNLFSHNAEPVSLDQTRYEYPVVPHGRRQGVFEIFSIDEVTAQNTRTRQSAKFEPFYSFHHASAPPRNARFWHSNRREHSTRRESETEKELPTRVYLSLVDLSGNPVVPDADGLFIRCTCTNANLPSELPPDYQGTEFQLEGAAAIQKIVALRRPTPSLPPPLDKSVLWDLISHLSLNYLSLQDEEKGRQSLQEILRLYNFSGSDSLTNQINGITSLTCSRDSAPVTSAGKIWFARGMRVEMELDETQFEGDGIYLFASVLERFLGLYVSMNSFSQLKVSLKGRKEVFEWQPRAGNSILI